VSSLCFSGNEAAANAPAQAEQLDTQRNDAVVGLLERPPIGP
jgi:hypothetical protein